MIHGVPGVRDEVPSAIQDFEAAPQKPRTGFPITTYRCPNGVNCMRWHGDHPYEPDPSRRCTNPGRANDGYCFLRITGHD